MLTVVLATSRRRWVQTYIHDLHISSLDYGELLDELVLEAGCFPAIYLSGPQLGIIAFQVEHIGSVVTQSVIYTAVQAATSPIYDAEMSKDA